MRIKFNDARQQVSELSGGNQQKVVIGRWVFMDNMKLLVMDEPTQGIDIGVKHDIYVMIREFSRKGIGVIFVSSELFELIGDMRQDYIFKGRNRSEGLSTQGFRQTRNTGGCPMKKSEEAAAILRKFSLLIIIACMGIVFAILQPRFMSVGNIINILRQASIQGILAIGLTFVVVSGEIDLSFGAVSSLAAILSLMLVIKGVPVPLTWLIVICLALLMGLVNAFVVINLKIPALLATIGTWLGIGGVVAWVAQGTTVWTSKYPPIFEIFGRGNVFGFIPMPVIILFFFAILGVLILEHSVLGRYFYAVGGNPDAATHAGISIRKVKRTGFLFISFLAGVGGLIMSSMFTSATPSVGQQFFFPAIIAVYLGSIFLKDGIPNLWGTVVASLFLAVLSNGFNLIGLMYWHENLAQGLLMILSISVITKVSKKDIKGVSV